VIESLKEGNTIEGVALEHGVALEELRQWQHFFCENSATVFSERKLPTQNMEKSCKEEYINRIRSLRLKENLSQRQVAEYLGISNKTYLRYENGISPMPIDYLVRLVRLYGVSADYILGIID
jgi:DNA-binding XRE family transcriptional regulator